MRALLMVIRFRIRFRIRINKTIWQTLCAIALGSNFVAVTSTTRFISILVAMYLGVIKQYFLEM